MKALAEKLEVINLQLARKKAMRRSALHWLFVTVFVGILIVAAALAVLKSPYLGWDYSAPETAVMGVAIHALEWGFAVSYTHLLLRILPLYRMIAKMQFPKCKLHQNAILAKFRGLHFFRVDLG